MLLHRSSLGLIAFHHMMKKKKHKETLFVFLKKTSKYSQIFKQQHSQIFEQTLGNYADVDRHRTIAFFSKRNKLNLVVGYLLEQMSSKFHLERAAPRLDIHCKRLRPEKSQSGISFF